MLKSESDSALFAGLGLWIQGFYRGLEEDTDIHKYTYIYIYIYIFIEGYIGFRL